MRLGDFLLMRGKVSKAEIDDACRMQRVNNHMLGVLAVDRGMISFEQVEEILNLQSRMQPRIRFGELAIKQGYLTKVQIDNLLKIQDENRLRIGEILVLQSRLTERELLLELREYRKLLAADQKRSA